MLSSFLLCIISSKKLFTLHHKQQKAFYSVQVNFDSAVELGAESKKLWLLTALPLQTRSLPPFKNTQKKSQRRNLAKRKVKEEIWPK